MARYFIGENGYFPSWVGWRGRWLLQRVFTTVKGMIAEADSLSRPAVSYEALVWAPALRGLNSLLPFMGCVEASRAIHELNRIFLVCSKCDWSGAFPTIEARPTDRNPTSWLLRCPKCCSVVGPKLESLDLTLIVQRWKVKGSPKLDPPGAASMMTSIMPIMDLEEWIRSFEPMENELAYVGQQLWSNFAEFTSAAGPRLVKATAIDQERHQR